jgi:lambda family phage minor tail protein L
MSTDLIVTDLQKLAPGSGLITLYEMQISDTPNTFIYLSNGYDSDSNKIQFRDKESPFTIRTYDVIPAMMDSVEKNTDGPLPRPTFTIANVLRTTTGSSLSGAMQVGNAGSPLPFDKLVGMKVIRRVTLEKYLVGGTADPGAVEPIEYPQEIYYIDRVSEQTNKAITFELVSPFDLQGVTLPRRNVISTGCSWDYQGAGNHRFEYEKKGGCTWNQESKVSLDGTEYTLYVNKDEELILNLVASNFTTWVGSANKDDYIKTIGNTTNKVESDGSLTPTAVTDYWQCTNDSTTSAPADGSVNWRRIRIHSTYSSASEYSAYIDTQYNDYVTFAQSEIVKGASVSVTRLWKTSYRTQTANNHVGDPELNRYWSRADICNKRLGSCAIRFGTLVGATGSNFATDPATPGNYPKVARNDDVVLPFGGFPTSRSFG